MHDHYEQHRPVFSLGVLGGASTFRMAEMVLQEDFHSWLEKISGMIETKGFASMYVESSPFPVF